MHGPARANTLQRRILLRGDPNYVAEMGAERCEQCRFDGDQWTDAEAMAAITELPARWRSAILELTADELGSRPIPEMWSIAEYVDHVREVLFGMRFLLDTAVAQPDTNLGDPPDSTFDAVPRMIDIEVALAGIEREASALRDRLDELSVPEWRSTAVIGGEVVDARWVARHAVHDATHHLLDVERLRP